jgi:DNA polymerase alpha subunit B
MELSFKDLFKMQVVQKIDLFLESNPNTRIVIVPSPNDAHHPSVFPQSPFNFHELFEDFVENVERIRRQVTLVSNPSMFKINEVVFGITTTDIVKHMGPEDTTRVQTGRKGALFSRLPAHLWNQHSFYPMFPPAKNSVYDINQMEHVAMKVKPDVLILSSIFNPVALEMDKVIVINPGRLTKGLNGGTFARMTINPLDEDIINEAREDETANTDGILNQVYKRAAVQLIRI